MVALGCVVVLQVEAQPEQGPQHLLAIGVVLERGQRLLEARARRRPLSLRSFNMRASATTGDRVLRVLADGALVGRLRPLGVALQFLEARDRDQRRVARRAARLRPLGQIGEQPIELPVALSVQLEQALQRKVGARLGQDDAGVALDQGLAARTLGVRLVALGRLDGRRGGGHGRPCCRRAGGGRGLRTGGTSGGAGVREGFGLLVSCPVG